MFSALTYPRRITEEIMDAPGLDPAAHAEALQGLRRINHASHAAQRMLIPIQQLAARENLRKLSLLDIACGGGDVPVTLAALARNLGIDIHLTLANRSPTAIAQAAAAAHHAGLSCRTEHADAPHHLPGGSFDIVTNSLFLHHLHTADHVIALLNNLRTLASRMIVISDLRRSRLGYATAWLGCRLLSRSPIVHHDGPVSVRAAWTHRELAAFAEQANLNSTQIYRCWPWRMLLVWQRQMRS